MKDGVKGEKSTRPRRGRRSQAQLECLLWRMVTWEPLCLVLTAWSSLQEWIGEFRLPGAVGRHKVSTYDVLITDVAHHVVVIFIAETGQLRVRTDTQAWPGLPFCQHGWRRPSPGGRTRNPASWVVSCLKVSFLPEQNHQTWFGNFCWDGWTPTRNSRKTRSFWVENYEGKALIFWTSAVAWDHGSEWTS